MDSQTAIENIKVFKAEIGRASPVRLEFIETCLQKYWAENAANVRQTIKNYFPTFQPKKDV